MVGWLHQRQAKFSGAKEATSEIAHGDGTDLSPRSNRVAATGLCKLGRHKSLSWPTSPEVVPTEGGSSGRGAKQSNGLP